MRKHNHTNKENVTFKTSSLEQKQNPRKRDKYSDFGPLQIDDYDTFLENSKKDFYSVWDSNEKQDKTYKLDDFEIVERLGHGSFGQVALVKNKLSQRHRYHAMKVLEKRHIFVRKQVENTRTEKNITLSLMHPMMIHMEYFFQDKCYLYLIMPYMPGRDLYIHLKEHNRFQEPASQFYSAQIILALEYLHYLHFIHRDIKPENILLDHTGYIKLSDFGFCKRIEKGRTYTICGTMEYMAPELLLNRGYGVSADWWSVGVLIYELNAGISPFYSRRTKNIYNKIVTNSYTVPIFFSADLRDIIRNMLEDDTTKRYGNLKNGADDIKKHKWFRSINWLGLLCRKMKATYVPEVGKIKHHDNSDSNLRIENCDDEMFKKVFENF